MARYGLIDFSGATRSIADLLAAKGHRCALVVSEARFREETGDATAVFLSVEDMFASSNPPFDLGTFRFFLANYEWVRRVAQRWVVGETNHDDVFQETFRAFATCVDALNAAETDVVFSGIGSPHHFYNFLFYLAATYLEIPHFLFTWIPFTNRLNIVRGLERTVWETTTSYRDHVLIDEYIAKVRAGSDSKLKDFKEGLSRRKNPRGHFLALSMLVGGLTFARSSLALFRKRRLGGIVLLPSRRSYTFFYALKALRSKLRVNRLGRYYGSLVQEKLPPHYVLFFGPYQPEAATLPDAGEFADARLAVAHLRRIVPVDVPIVFKEHPGMFLYDIQGFSLSIDDHRSREFYDDLRRMGVIFADHMLDSVQLMQRSEFVVGLNGSFVIEAAILGIPAFRYARGWYGDLPGVAKIDFDTEYADLQRSTRASDDELKEYLYYLSENSLPNVLGIASLERQQGDLAEFCNEFHRILEQYAVTADASNELAVEVRSR